MLSTERADPSRVRVGVFGGAGYAGRELLRLLARHEGAEIVFATSGSSAGAPSAVPGIAFVAPDDAPVDAVDLVFLCVPHGEAAEWVRKFRGGPRIVDLTADHRPGSGREEGAVYGLAERDAGEARGAELIANPGCYPTGVLLSLLPLVERGLIDADRLMVVNAASGVTGAGRTPKPHLLFAEVSENYRAYGEGNRHNHLKEIRATLPPGASILFQPHLLPVSRGILETIIAPVSEGVDAEAVRGAWREDYREAGAIRILDEGLPDLAAVVDTDRLVLGASDVDRIDPPVVTIVAAFDNLGKGAAGQAVQNMNLMFGWPRDRGIRC